MLENRYVYLESVLLLRFVVNLDTPGFSSSHTVVVSLSNPLKETHLREIKKKSTDQTVAGIKKKQTNMKSEQTKKKTVTGVKSNKIPRMNLSLFRVRPKLYNLFIYRRTNIS